MRITLPILASLFSLAAHAQSTDPAQIPSGTYALDSGHGKITWLVLHHGFSTYAGQFYGVNATLALNSADPTKSTLDVTVDMNAVGTFNDRMDEILKGADWFDTATYPAAHYVSTSVTRTGPRTATIQGNLTLHGTTKPVAIDVTFNGVGPGHGSTEVGFDGTALIHRTQFGVSGEFPGVADEVKLLIEGEFNAQ